MALMKSLPSSDLNQAAIPQYQRLQFLLDSRARGTTFGTGYRLKVLIPSAMNGRSVPIVCTGEIRSSGVHVP